MKLAFWNLLLFHLWPCFWMDFMTIVHALQNDIESLFLAGRKFSKLYSKPTWCIVSKILHILIGFCLLDFVFWSVLFKLSTKGVGISSTPTRIPSFSAVKRETLFSANSSFMIQHSCENCKVVRSPWGQALLLLDSSTLLQQDIFSVSAPAPPGGMQSFSLQWKGKVCSQSQRGGDLYRSMVHNWSIFM